MIIFRFPPKRETLLTMLLILPCLPGVRAHNNEKMPRANTCAQHRYGRLRHFHSGCLRYFLARLFEWRRSRFRPLQPSSIGPAAQRSAVRQSAARGRLINVGCRRLSCAGRISALFGRRKPEITRRRSPTARSSAARAMCHFSYTLAHQRD